MKAADPNIVKRILNLGRRYTPAPLPADISRGKMAHCFDNCAARALDERYRYVEGVAQDPRSGIWILHAWLTDGERAYDPTWRAFDKELNEIPVPTIYVGVEMNIRHVARFMSKTGYAGVFPNYWRDPELARAAITNDTK